jgi:predicted amidohydrolase YtcJ
MDGLSKKKALRFVGAGFLLGLILRKPIELVRTPIELGKTLRFGRSCAHLERIMKKAFLGLGVLCVCTSALAQQAIPDLILFNGKIFTSVAAHPYVEALAIRGERIVAIGDTKTIVAMAGPKTSQIDLHGGTAIPGINDAHHHFGLEPPNAVDVDLKTMDPTWSQAKEGITAAIAKSPGNSLINVEIGEAIFQDVSVNRDALDQVAPHNPVMLGTFTGHGFILNTAALRLCGVAENQPDPLGGRFERDAKGRLTGTVREYAGLDIERVLNDSVPESVAVGQLRQTLDEAERFGITSIQELSAFSAPARAVSLLEAVPTEIRVRIVRMPGTTAARNVEEGKGVPAHPTNLITVSGEKWMVDGVGIEGTFTPRGAIKIPAALPLDAGFNNLPLTFPKEEIAAMLQESIKNNDQLLLHISGYKGAKATLDAMDASGGKAVWDGRRVRFEHGDGVFPDLYERIKQDGVVVVQNPSHLMGGAMLTTAPPGTELFRDGQPLKSLLAAGIPVALGSDGPLNPYLNIMFATIHADRHSEAITREQAVIAYTLTSAYAEFQEKEKGSLEVGKLADIAVLSQDIFTVPMQELPKTESVLTLVGGKAVYKAKDLNTK